MVVNGPQYRSASMMPTPRRALPLQVISQNGATIRDRGNAMRDLGDRMQEAANTLNHIASGTVGKGLSIDKVRESAEDVYSDLKTAGIRYSPSGAAIARYGQVLTDIQGTVSSIIDDCEDLWLAVRNTSEELETATQAAQPTDEAQSAFDLAVYAWRNRADDYHSPYDSWDDAYNTALDGLQDANENGVEDSWLDNALPALEVLGTILTYVGAALAIVACIVGGPFVLAAALVGLAALGVTLLLAAGSRADGGDIFWAAFGVFPFGKAFGAIKGIAGASGAAGRLGAAGNGVAGMATDLVGLGGRTGIRTVSTVIESGTAARILHGSGAVNQHGSSVLRSFFRGMDGPSVFQRLTQGFDNAVGSHFAEGAGALSHAARSNLSQFLGQSGGGRVIADLMSDGSSSLGQVVNVIDNPIKTASGIASELGWI